MEWRLYTLAGVELKGRRAKGKQQLTPVKDSGI